MTARPPLPRDLRSTPTYRWAEQFLRGLRHGADDQVVDARDLSTSPDGSTVVMTAWQRGTDAAADLTPVVAVIDLTTRTLRSLTRRDDNIHSPVWLPSSKDLVAIHTTATEDLPILLALDGTTSPATTTTLVGRIENLIAAPNTDQLALIVAEPGAEISDVFGSGRVTAGTEHPSWQPEVSAEGRSGRRRLWIGPLGGAATPLATEWNIWEACWAGNDALLAVASPGPEEDAWYDAELVHIPLDGTPPRSLLRPDRQLGQPRVDASGTRASIIVGTASDRGLLAGDVTMVDLTDSSTTSLPTRLHVTSQHWEPDGGLVVAGQRGPATVVAWHGPDGAITEWATDETFGPGDLTPTVAQCGPRRVITMLESHGRPPTCGTITADGFEPLMCAQGSISQQPLRDGCVWTPLTWKSTDDTSIDGYLLRPSDPGPHRLITVIHGGPVWSWRNIWLPRIPLVPALLERGFAVLLPNPRGSHGHGEDFVRGIIGEVGGLDTADILSGIDHLVHTGITQAHTLGVVGGSYGGFLSSWLATQSRFAVAVAISPATDWVSQHFTTNIPRSDTHFLTGDPRDPGSHYRYRSPLVAASASTSPLLLTAGAHDLATPPAQALIMHRALLELGVDTDIAIYPEEGHDVHAWPAVVDHLTRIVDWIEAYLPGFPAATSDT